jgi:predicted DNA-binding protein YlxM (UPF0122 family)
MKHNFIGNDIKRIALDEYLEGDVSMTQVADKYKICMNTLCAYKRDNIKYVNDYTLYLANKKSGNEVVKPDIKNYEKAKKRKAPQKKETDKIINDMINEANGLTMPAKPDGLTVPPKPDGLTMPKPIPLTAPKHNNLNVPSPKNNVTYVQPKNDIFATKPNPINQSNQSNPNNHNLKYTKPHNIKPQESPNKPKSFKVVSYEDEITKMINGN